MRFVLAAVCALALDPLAAASTRTLSPEQPLTSPTAAPSQEVFHADIASNGSMALALWVDYRSTFPDVFFTRIDASGNVLDPIGIALTSSSLYEDNPVRVVSRGRGFLAGWTSRSVTSNDPMGVWLAAIDGDGHASSTRVAPGRLLDLATNGDTTAVIARVPLNFTDYLFDVYATILDANFSVIRSTKVASNVYPRIVATSIGFLLAWFDESGPSPRVVAVRLDPTGAAIDSQPFPLVSVTRYPTIAVAASGADAYVAIAEDSSHAAEIAHVGAGGGVTLTSIEAADSITSLSVAADGSFTVAAKKTNMPVLRSIGANGATTAVTQLSTVGDSIGLFAFVGNRPYAVVMETGRLLGGFAGDPLNAIARAPYDQGRPSIASDGFHLLFVWAERHTFFSYAIVGVLTDLQGNALAPLVEIAPPHQYAPTPAVIFDGTDYVVVFQENREPNEAWYQFLVARRVSRDGVVAPSETILSKTANFRAKPRLASDGSSVLVAWFEGYFPAPVLTAAIYGGSSFAASGSTVLNGIGINPITGYNMDVAWNGQTYVIVAEQLDLVAYIVSAAGALLSTKTVVAGDQNLNKPFGKPFGSRPSIAWGTDRALVVFEGDVSSETSQVHGVFIDRDAALPFGGAFTIDDPGANSFDFFPHPAWDGSAFVVGWDRGSHFLADNEGYADAFAARVATDTTLRDAFVVAATSLDDDWPVPFVTADGHTIMVYRRMVPESGGAHQLFTRLVTPSRTRIVRHP